MEKDHPNWTGVARLTDNARNCRGRLGEANRKQRSGDGYSSESSSYP
jgi:hypothetical protein